MEQISLSLECSIRKIYGFHMNLDSLNTDVKILIIDDESINLILLEHTLRHSGYNNIVSIQNSEIAISTYQEELPDLILLDLEMPIKSGFELLKEFNELNDPLLPPIIVLTGHHSSEYRHKALEAGARDFLTKPFDRVELLARIQNLIEMRQNLKLVNYQKQILEQEHLLAQSLFEKLLGNTGFDLQGISCFHAPLNIFSGDLFLVGFNPNKEACYIILADGMGHGLSAAISLIPIAMVFHDLIKKDTCIIEMTKELNSKLDQLLPDDRFVAAVILKLDFKKNLISVWNGSMPPPLLISQNKKTITEFPSKNMALGIIPNEIFEPEVSTQTLNAEEKIVMFSDGITEALNTKKIYFDQVLREQKNSILYSEKPFDVIKKALSEHLIGSVPFDDMCLAAIDIGHVIAHKDNS